MNTIKPCEIVSLCNHYRAPLEISQQVALWTEVVIFLLFSAFIAWSIFRKRYDLLKRMGVTFIAVLLFEFLIDPVVENRGFSGWTYFLHDITFVVTLAWVMLISFSIDAVEIVFSKSSNFMRFLLTLCLLDLLVLICEIFLVSFGLRTYGPSAAANPLGLYIPYTAVPFGVAIVIPAMLALVLGFIKYWEKLLGIGSGTRQAI